MKPCLDELKTESGMEMVFKVPSPATVEFVCQLPRTRSVRYRMLWLKPACERNWNWKFAPTVCGLSRVTGDAAVVSLILASMPPRLKTKLPMGEPTRRKSLIMELVPNWAGTMLL